MFLDSSTPTSDKAINYQHNDRSNDCAYQSGTLSWAVPTEPLSKVCRDKGAHDAQDRGQNKASGFVFSGHNKFCDDARDEANNDRPENAHCVTSYLETF
jgi:hypothetical protein